MKLSEKIYYCRKKAGKSQEELAELLGVSRQAVSKWETGDAEPEIGKLRLLSETFGVSVDWLLSEEEPQGAPESAQAAPAQGGRADWVDALPGMLGRLLRRYGWLAGVYIALTGAGFALIGGLALGMSRSMFSSVSGLTDDLFSSLNGGRLSGWTGWPGSGDLPWDTVSGSMAGFARNNPVAVFGTVVLIVGLCLIVAGVVLAVVLKRRARS